MVFKFAFPLTIMFPALMQGLAPGWDSGNILGSTRVHWWVSGSRRSRPAPSPRGTPCGGSAQTRGTGTAVLHQEEEWAGALLRLGHSNTAVLLTLVVPILRFKVIHSTFLFF